MRRFLGVFFASVLFSNAATASDVDMNSVKELVRSEIQGWLQTQDVVDAVKAQNAAHANIGQADIDRMDKTWRAETKAAAQPMISGVLNNKLSKYLADVKGKGEGLYTEIFVMDNKGLNVGQSDVTSDYWQGDEAKFTETYGKGADALHVSEVEFDESSQTYQVQVSLPVLDGGQPIGAVTIGLDAEAIQ